MKSTGFVDVDVAWREREYFVAGGRKSALLLDNPEKQEQEKVPLTSQEALPVVGNAMNLATHGVNNEEDDELKSSDIPQNGSLQAEQVKAENREPVSLSREDVSALEQVHRQFLKRGATMLDFVQIQALAVVLKEDPESDELWWAFQMCAESNIETGENGLASSTFHVL